MRPTYDRDFVVVGGGIGGLATAAALGAKGYSVLVLEKMPEFAEIGAGLQLAPNASRMLDRLGVLGEVAKDAVFPARAVLMDAIANRPIMTMEFGEEFRAAFGYRYLVMHRGDLLRALHDACEVDEHVTLETGREVVALAQMPEGARVECSDGAVYDAHGVIGADGLWSLTRRFVADDGVPIPDGCVAYRGTIPVEHISEHAGLDNVVMWIGPDMHFVQYPISRGALFNQVAVFRSKRFLAGEADWGAPDELEAHYRPVCDDLQFGLGLINRERFWVMYDRHPIEAWRSGRVVLLGDAAHPMYQYIAQGANQVLEDALCLAECVSRADDIEAAFAAYESERAPRAARVQRSARLFGDVVHSSGIGALLRDELLGGVGAKDYRYVNWLYGGGPPLG